MQDLERNGPIVPRVMRTIHHRHSSAAYLLFYAVAATDERGFCDRLWVEHWRQ
jgi:hypothetical protein